jgi:hypothetical protein
MEACPRSFRDIRGLVSFVCRLTIHLLEPKLTSYSDIAYYGVNLNQSVVLTRIGFAKGATPWETLYNTAIGNIIVQAAVRIPFKVDTDTLYKRLTILRDTCQASTLGSSSPTALAVCASNS